ncbi:class I SAM-dependent DNA methyltransferase [Dinoroseobacter sp. S375]|uniref:class I SAM-dependent DNA methyltransferase n=1 Tax=Dinoroseobacter sp. S375 TaxID=3415136 RepID=UPI003C7DEB97
MQQPAASFEEFLAQAQSSGGSEMANCHLFIERLCGFLNLPQPELSTEENRFNDYVFERRVDFKHPDGTTTPGRIDLYKRDCFILEAKQSSKRPTTQNTLPGLPEDHAQIKKGQARRGSRRWDKVMDAARRQAENYARALPVEHGYPPFLMVLDIGNELQIFADFSGQGKNYTHFPDRASYRLSMDDLLDADVQERLRLIWTDPLALDPARHSARVTQDIAERLARIALRLERRHDPHDVASFLMRCLFTMFAEDVELVPDHAFEKLLGTMVDDPQHFVPALEDLWSKMDTGGYAAGINKTLKRFNGTLFTDARALPLDADDIRELWVASQRSWQDVEPAIFGTLLERALDPRDRSRLGAHYTPRVYVERLVIPTIIQPLRADWDTVRQRAKELEEAYKPDDALQTVRNFHHQLCTTRVLDPACGTGNFLYVALELMKRLEGEVLEVIADLGGQEGLAFQGETVSPAQFHGIELNPRAVPIADLVLWIGYLKWQLRTSGPASISEPILHAYGTIREGDAILAHNGTEPVCETTGHPVQVWDRVTFKPNPLAPDQSIPDPAATIPMVRYIAPKPAPWPEVEFIVGNPPFIGGKDMRAELGDGYAEAVWAARKDIPGGADFVMHFWDAAAARLLAKGTKTKPNPLRRFGFITTNSITQTFSRRVIEKHLKAKAPLSLVYAVGDHPWQKSAGKAAVRIAMTVAEAGDGEGVLAEVVAEADLNTDAPRVDLRKHEGKITAKLTLGADVTRMRPLWANEALSSPGVKLHGAGFIVTPAKAQALGLGRVPGLEKHILSYRNGRDLAQRPRGVMVIDLFGLTAQEVQERFPAVYQHVADTVKPDRDVNNRATYRDNWWLFGEPRSDMRPVLEPLPRYIATVETTKHRTFQFLDCTIRPDNMLVAIGLDDLAVFAVLSSRLHVHFAINNGGWMGVGNDPRYSKSRTFDPYPFPALSDTARATLAQLGDRLDAFRKDRIAAQCHLTMTKLYNALEHLRELEAGIGGPMTDAERDVYDAGQIRILAELHDQIDRAVLDAYGWSDLAPALVGKVGGTLPSLYKTPDQERAEEELLCRLVALNEDRAAEEARGDIHWLRPEYQIPRVGKKAPQPAMDIAAQAAPVLPDAIKPAWPKDPMAQIRTLRRAMAVADTPLAPADLSARFKGGRNREARIERLLADMVELGIARLDTGRANRYFLPD